MKTGFIAAIAIIVLLALTAHATQRVALMDFSTDDNSYRSVQVAADFSSVVQARLADEPGVEWVERAQLDKARQELELSVAEIVSGGSSIQRGKWVKADWMVTGHFSLDDKSQRTLFIEITDLKHADALASQTITFPGTATASFQTDTNQIKIAVAALRQLISEAHQRQQELAGKILVAPLFLLDATGFGPGFSFSQGSPPLEQEFNEALKRATATNSQVQLIRFPKAYRSIEESEMVLGGLVDADKNAWQQTADLYVWGTYATTNRMERGKKPVGTLEITLHLWNGTGQPVIVREELPGDYQPIQIEAALVRLANRVIANARRPDTQTDSGAIRKSIAQSLVETYDQMTSRFHGRTELGLQDQDKFLQAVHMLETACFFDPDNAKARLLYITCRWGWWMDFGFTVKNEFWSEWRRSEAWGNYANRFGLGAASVELPFPYQQEGIPVIYLRSLEKVIAMFPQWHSTNEMALEDEWRQQGVHTWLEEAELHGFPKDMPHDLAWNWKQDLQAEQWKRLTVAANFVADNWTPSGRLPPTITSTLLYSIFNEDQPPQARLALIEKIWPKCVMVAQKFGRQWIFGAGQLGNEREDLLTQLCVQSGKPEEGARFLSLLSTNETNPPTPAAQVDSKTSNKTLPKTLEMPGPPAWMMNVPTHSMFQLYPPAAWPLEVKPDMQEIQFPKQFEVQSVDRLEFLDDQLLILATDTRSAPTSDNTPDVSAEILAKHRRLWTLKPGTETPMLYEPTLLPQNINDFLIRDSRLWVAGKVTGYLDLKQKIFRKFGLADGFNQPAPDTLAWAGENLFVADDRFQLSMYDVASDRWSNLPQPMVSLLSSSESPVMLAGNQQYLGFTAGSVVFYDLSHHVWLNLTNVNNAQYIRADGSNFWIAGRKGLQCYNPANQTLKSWTAPTGFNSLFIGMMHGSFFGSSAARRDYYEQTIGEQIQELLKRLQDERIKNHLKNCKSDPFHLNWRVSSGIMAADGDFVWFGIGDHLLLWHRPSETLVACCAMPVRDTISSLAISKTAVWVGTAYGDHQLFRISKDAFLSVPRSRWVSLAISPDERARIIRGMSVRDQAMYAFYAGDDGQVDKLLGDLDPSKASLEEMYLLLFSNDAFGTDRPELMQAWADHISARFPDSPWAKAAQAAVSENKEKHKVKQHAAALLAKYDLDHDGALNAQEKAAMEKDPVYQRQEQGWNDVQLDVQLQEIMKKFDRNGDGKLDRDELGRLRTQIALYSQASPQMLAGHKIVVSALLTQNIPSVADILKKYDTNNSGGLDAIEFKALAQDLRSKPAH